MNLIFDNPSSQRKFPRRSLASAPHRREADAEMDSQQKARHFRPVWIVLLLLIPCLALTAYYARYGITVVTKPDSILPNPSYAVVMFLVYLDSVGLVVLTLLLSRNLIRAYFEKRHRLLGSGFRAKLIAAFIGFALIPTVMLATVASGVISEVIEVWFNDQIMQVLNDSEELAKLYHEDRIALAVNSARAISKEIFREDILSPEHRELLISAMGRKRTEYNLAGVEVFSPRMETLARVVHPDLTDAVLSLPVGQLVLQVLDTREELNSVQEATIGRLVRAATPILSYGNTDKVKGVVVVSVYVPESLLVKMDVIEKQFHDYRQIKEMKAPIKVGAYLFVAVVTVLILFGATWFGFYVARGITVPIQRLAEGTEAVAKGDLDVRIDVKATDEIGTLVESFNRMTADLRQSKSRLEEANYSLVQSNAEIDQRRAYTETVVETIASGVLSIAADGTITTFNHSAERILGISSEQFRGRHVTEAFKEFNLTLFQTAYDQMLLDDRESLSSAGQMEAHGLLLTIGLNVSRMRNDAGNDLGFVFVFEDRTELIKAQKTAAWQEVAQRIAHEIKNPLTPIQLSAQRLRKKFFEKSSDFEEIFDQSTNVIVGEVTSLKRMVDEFSKFARMPAPHMTRESLGEIIQKVVSLYAGAHRKVEMIVNLDDSVPEVSCDAEQLRRVFVNLFDNAVQAMNSHGRIWVSTECDRRRHRVIVRVADEGTGIQPEDQERLFVPYFSRKRTGTGLGLAIVHRIITDHNGSIRAENHEPQGAIFTFDLPI
ncbi:MAG: ATP-binding protein [Nitrospirales bacterium]|nr:HAMP domain-containing protein [Nitrospira sp.]MDR4499854.1 ATP-binding protein [Nitrospirales bacterium]